MTDVQPDADLAVVVSDLSLAYPAHGGGREFQAVEGMSFTLRRGETLAVLGESGSGKSTLTRFLAGRATDPAQKSAHINAIGGEATVLGQSLRKISRRNRGRLTAFVGHLGQSYPFELSKGQRQRVAVMRSLIMDPALLVADEPTLGVDANNRPRIISLLNWYRARTGASMLLISHDIGMLEALVDEVIVMQHGRAVGRGQINDVFRDASHKYVQQLAEALRATAYDEIADD